MTPQISHKTAAFVALTGVLAACEPQGKPVVDQAPFTPEYLGVETRLLDGNLVDFFVSMRGARDKKDVAKYAECAAAQYALIRGYGFARHVRSNIAEKGGLWIGDSAYTISDALPKGFKTIDAEVVAAECDENDIPKV